MGARTGRRSCARPWRQPPLPLTLRCGVVGWTQPNPHRSTQRCGLAPTWRQAALLGRGRAPWLRFRAARVELSNFGQLSPAVAQWRCSARNLAPQPSPSAGWLGSLSCRGCCHCLLAWWPKGRCHMSSVPHGAEGQEGPQRWGGVGTPAHGATPTESLLPATDAWWGPPRCQATLTW